MQGLERALKQQTVSLFFSESPTNPYLRCVDVSRISQLCHQHGALVCIDSTFATPINQCAVTLGADIVIHSATKYLAGHNDVMAGVHASRPHSGSWPLAVSAGRLFILCWLMLRPSSGCSC
jgi:cystathionine gamma-synthase